MNGYPDDIRRFDHDPRSPFYKEWRCKQCGEPEGNGCDDDYCAEDDEEEEP